MHSFKHTLDNSKTTMSNPLLIDQSCGCPEGGALGALPYEGRVWVGWNLFENWSLKLLQLLA
jgi:hypothetical protein